jgi:hypothetical protein
VIGIALVAFPKLALGLSGFETGVLVMPQVADGEGTPEERLARRIAGTRRLLSTAAAIIAVLYSLRRHRRYADTQAAAAGRGGERAGGIGIIQRAAA